MNPTVTLIIHVLAFLLFALDAFQHAQPTRLSAAGAAAFVLAGLL